MIVTAVLARLDAGGQAVVSRPARGALGLRLGDSKALVAHGDIALGEAWARALALAGFGRTPFSDQSPDALLDALSIDVRSTLRARCPAHVDAQCWSPVGEGFVAAPELVATVAKDLPDPCEKGRIDCRSSNHHPLCARAE